MTEISFTSTIRPVTPETFNKIADKIGQKNSVNYPWTVKESIKSTSAYTTNICDCTMFGLTDGHDVFMAHICPTLNPNNYFSKIKQIITQKMGAKSQNWQGILIGSQQTQKSQNIYSDFENFLKQSKIPYSELKTSRTPVNVAYSSINDEWLVTSRSIKELLQTCNKSDLVLKFSFDKVKISELDKIV